MPPKRLEAILDGEVPFASLLWHTSSFRGLSRPNRHTGQEMQVLVTSLRVTTARSKNKKFWSSLRRDLLRSGRKVGKHEADSPPGVAPDIVTLHTRLR